MSLTYFAYGSNLSRADMAVRCPGARPLEPAVLSGWRLAFRGVADIEPADGASVAGALWRLTPACIAALDRYEGAPAYYRQVEVEVASADGPVAAMTYVMCDRAYLGLPSGWYLGRIEEGYRDWGLRLDALADAVASTRHSLEARGVRRYRPEGRKRMRAVLEEA